MQQQWDELAGPNERCRKQKSYDMIAATRHDVAVELFAIFPAKISNVIDGKGLVDVVYDLDTPPRFDSIHQIIPPSEECHPARGTVHVLQSDTG